MFNWLIHWRERRRIVKHLVAYAKTKDGRKFIQAMRHGNLILADYDAHVLGAEHPDLGKTLKINLPNDFHARS